MTDFFVPFSGDKPAALTINGHRVVILSTESEVIKSGLAHVGGDRVRRFSRVKSRAALRRFTNRLAKSSNAGIVIAPAEIEVEDLIRNLESELPWVQ